MKGERAVSLRAGPLALWMAWCLAVPIGSASADPAIDRRLRALEALLAPPRLRASDHAAVRPAAHPPPPARPSNLADEGCAVESPWRATPEARRRRIRWAIRDAARRYGVDGALIRSVIRHESNFQVNAVSHRGARGLMQLMPATADELGVRCPFDPRENILGGTRYLRRMYDRFGNWPAALAAYNAGPARVASGRVPYESRRYARRVLRTWKGHARTARPAVDAR